MSSLSIALASAIEAGATTLPAWRRALEWYSASLLSDPVKTKGLTSMFVVSIQASPHRNISLMFLRDCICDDRTRLAAWSARSSRMGRSRTGTRSRCSSYGGSGSVRAPLPSPITAVLAATAVLCRVAPRGGAAGADSAAAG